jgi:hypothetical protein
MSIFGKATPEPEITGADRLREALKQKSRKRALSLLARDVNDNMTRDSNRPCGPRHRQPDCR